MPPKKAATSVAKAKTTAPKKPAPAKKALVAKKAAAKKAPAKKASTKKAGQKRARSPTPSESESDSSDDDTLKAPPAKRTKRQADEAGDSTAEDEEDAPVPQAKASKKATPAKDTVNPFGKFDIYDKDLPCLATGNDKGSPDFEKLLGLMKEFQAKRDFTARVAIPESYGTSDGAFEIQGFEDPMSGEQYEISLEGLQLTGKDKSTVKAKLSVDGGCGLSSSSGTLSLHRCWTKPEDLGEVFECIINVNVSYSGLYRRKGHGSGMRLNMKCWAIRARKNASGEEIGLTLN